MFRFCRRAGPEAPVVRWSGCGDVDVEPTGAVSGVGHRSGGARRVRSRYGPECPAAGERRPQRRRQPGHSACPLECRPDEPGRCICAIGRSHGRSFGRPSERRLGRRRLGGSARGRGARLRRSGVVVVPAFRRLRSGPLSERNRPLLRALSGGAAYSAVSAFTVWMTSKPSNSGWPR
jgi:hypothetical protein